jgi:uncharacterized membrane protein (DUF485 family)
MSKTVYNLTLICITVFAVAWIGITVTAMIASFPIGWLVSMILLIPLGILVAVYREQKNNKEDAYYSKHVDQ